MEEKKTAPFRYSKESKANEFEKVITFEVKSANIYCAPHGRCCGNKKKKKTMRPVCLLSLHSPSSSQTFFFPKQIYEHEGDNIGVLTRESRKQQYKTLKQFVEDELIKSISWKELKRRIDVVFSEKKKPLWCESLSRIFRNWREKRESKEQEERREEKEKEGKQRRFTEKSPHHLSAPG
jgi:hypothetical protein